MVENIMSHLTFLSHLQKNVMVIVSLDHKLFLFLFFFLFHFICGNLNCLSFDLFFVFFFTFSFSWALVFAALMNSNESLYVKILLGHFAAGFLVFLLVLVHPIPLVPSQVLTLLHLYLLTIKGNNIFVNKNKPSFSFGTIFFFCMKSDHLDLCRKWTLNKQYNKKSQARQIFTSFCTMCLLFLPGQHGMSIIYGILDYSGDIFFAWNWKLLLK